MACGDMGLCVSLGGIRDVHPVFSSTAMIHIKRRLKVFVFETRGVGRTSNRLWRLRSC